MKKRKNFYRKTHSKSKETFQNCSFKLLQKRNSTNELVLSKIDLTKQDIESALKGKNFPYESKYHLVNKTSCTKPRYYLLKKI